jgi:choline-sulfatase
MSSKPLVVIAAVALALLVAGVTVGANPSRTSLPEHPDLLLIVTDQTRQPQHWPDGWLEAHLPAEERLAEHGLVFTRFFANSSMCSPSRGSLFTGLYPAEHGVLRTLTYGGLVSDQETSLPTQLPNLARLLATAGYNVVLKGKWHLSKHSDGGPPDRDDVAAYGFHEWDPTTEGEGTGVDDFGGGCAQNDQAVVDAAVAFLATQKNPGRTTPFCLVVSLANPHDVLSYPLTWDQDNGAGCDNYGSVADFEQGIAVPPSCYTDDLALKPTAQAQSLNLYLGLGPLPTHQERLRYVNFYAYLHHYVDAQVGQLLDALGSLASTTVVIRTSDHGEMGLAHGGLRQKMFNCYDETIRVRTVISNPTLFPAPATTAALASTVDLVPTIAHLANVPNLGQYQLRGVDLSPLLADPAAAVQDQVLFTFDDDQAGTANGQTVVQQPNHLRSIRVEDERGEWTYARYFDPSPTGAQPEQYEMYQLRDAAGADVDPNQLDNVANPASPNYAAYAEDRARLAARLAEAERTRLYLFRDGFESGAASAWSTGGGRR